MTIAIWCILAAALLPIVTAGIAKRLGGRIDNHDPRGQAVGYAGAARRAHSAHLNGYEALPLFIAAVLVAELKAGPSAAVDALAVAFVLLRAAYTAAYIADRPTLRSVIWALGLLAALLIFTSPLWR